jgi:hypothetical protein
MPLEIQRWWSIRIQLLLKPMNNLVKKLLIELLNAFICLVNCETILSTASYTGL